MGSGKSFAGKYLSTQMAIPHFDLDHELVNITDSSISSIFSVKGERYFRKLESELLLADKFCGIISTGGGIVESQRNRDFLRSQFCIWLSPQWQSIYNRIKNSDRPLVKNKTELELKAIYQSRKPLYKACADIVYRETNLDELTKMI